MLETIILLASIAASGIVYPFFAKKFGEME